MLTYYNENNPFAANWLRALISKGLISDGYVDERSIEDVPPRFLRSFRRHHFFAGIGGWDYALRLAGWPDDRPVCTGSCPCQPFSVAGSQKGMDDERHLWPAFRWHIARLRPASLFGEQVASKAGRQWMAGVRDDLEVMGHAVGVADLCAAGVGAPHIRQRIFWVAYLDGERGQGLVSPRSVEEAGQWSGGRKETLHAICGDVFCKGTSWPQPLLRRMDDGFPCRMETLTGFGNAIVPQLAAEFIQASEEARC